MNDSLPQALSRMQVREEQAQETLPAAPAVRIESISKVFDHEGRSLKVLDNVSLSVMTGEMLCVMGASGAGKSTLLHIVGALDLPSSGKVLYGQTDITELSSKQLARFRNQSIGFVFQFHHLLSEFTALENVMMPGLLARESRRALSQRARELLNRVGLLHRASHRPGELSGGEQQRIALARALLMKPRVVLADEPTGNLDSKTSEAMHDLMFDINQTTGTTFLIVTHGQDLAARMPRVVTMRDGTIESDRRSASAPSSA